MFCLWNMLEQKPDMLRLWHGHLSCPRLNQLLILKVLNMKWAECLTSLPCCSVITKLLRLMEFWETSSCILSYVKSTKQPVQSQSPWGPPPLCFTGWSWSTRIIFIGMERFSIKRAQNSESLFCTGSFLLAKMTSSLEGCCNQTVGTTSRGFNTSSTLSLAPL